MLMSSRKKLAHRQNSVYADESVGLRPKRNKGDQINQPERAEKPAARREISRRPHVGAPQQSGNCRPKCSVTRDNFVSNLGNRRGTGNVIITPRQPFARGSTTQRAIDGLRREKNFARLVDVNDRALELLPRYFRKSHRCFLISLVLNLARSQHSPALDPQSAKMTLAIPNHERLRWRRSHARRRILIHDVVLVAAVCDRRTFISKLMRRSQSAATD